MGHDAEFDVFQDLVLVLHLVLLFPPEAEERDAEREGGELRTFLGLV